ncbi:sugar ABC transporter ATP-binding protein [Streptomyces zingiberis]|uniref:Sugar ABC transporter ATP-binding protein n=1 Tax=Streptomyces zingiberis TaxID=2053010 RepID=A0ABX1BWR7_9ACTN|nr:sugar ABC transporter ATP-binding protein [Streptomyces zingiberis]NJQ00187.1 sugar ABC transporter ATP-binding protein [Streptomyces zingiberis]
MTKSFPGMRALDDVTFSVTPGRFHSLVGGNGSGKSTLIKVLAGVYRADPGGTITVGPHARGADDITPAWSHQAGIRFVHQDLGLFRALSVTENLLGPELPRAYRSIDWRAAHEQAQDVLDRLGVPVAARRSVAGLRPAEATLVAIARGLRDADTTGVGLLVLDEPTARLPHTEVDELLERLGTLVAGGQTILYVSHRLDEVLDHSHSVTVLRDGVHRTTRPVEGLDRRELTRLIVGEERGILHKRGPAQADRSATPVLRVEGLTGGPLHGVDLDVHPGEIVAVAGLVGSGRTSLLETVFGVHGHVSGRVLLGGRPLRRGSIGAAIRGGAAYVPEDRALHSSFHGLGLEMNLSAAGLHRYMKKGFFRRRDELGDATADITRFSIRTVAPDTVMVNLSGGNQQKAVLARWLRRNPRLLLLDEPTQGVDVGSRAEIYEQITEVARGGAGVLLVSSDLDELLHLADRVHVFERGSPVACATGSAITREWVVNTLFHSTEDQ